ncbi:hypothetical protein FJTKL_06560 [Diaporthe vaccinii]|uniref:C2H2-type domain-containing protein n=1 Tax=Diaporthe vaccinii TaxID=105482 RepID=A0ABR4DPY8_9PEZI
MAGPSPERFQRALTSFRCSLSTRSPDLLDQFSFSSLQDLQTACSDMQNEMGQDGRLRRMRRIGGFIEAMRQLGESIEVFVNANDLVCFIWGPIKFLLGIAKTHVESFDKLLDVYEKVGSIIPGLMAYRSMLEKHPPLATVLEDYYSDILRFHEAALKVFARPTWKKLFKAAWKTFDTEFQPLLQSLANRRELLESEKGSASLYEISKAREEMAARHEAKKQELRRDEIEKHKWRLLQIKAQLGAADYQQDLEMAAEARNVTNSGDWVLQSPTFKHWADKAATRHSVLYVHGIPGAGKEYAVVFSLKSQCAVFDADNFKGKTTLVSSIIANLLDENSNNNDDQPTMITYFYMKHKQPEKDTHNGLLRAMMEQIVSRDCVLSDHLFDKFTSVEGMQLRSAKCLEPLIATALETYQQSFIVVDGLDEAAPGEAAKSLKWLLSLANGGIKEPTASVRILCSGRRDGIMDSLLSDQPAIALESIPEHNTDILSYCKHMGAEIRQSLDISSTMEDEIISKVASQANGMFLYARVVLDNLLGQITLHDLKRELEPDTFPKEIDQAYERVAIRMLQDAPPAARQSALKILGWVTCAARPLRWREIQSIFCIDVESNTMDYEERRLRVSCKKLCGSLIDVHQVLYGHPGPDDIVTVVHGSAREYLVQKPWINIALEHAQAATFCFRYLTSKPFRVHTESISPHVRQGYYGFQDYAVQHYLHHFERRTGLESHEDIYQQTMEAARKFLAIYSLSIPTNLAEMSYQDMENFFSQFPKDKRERASILSLEFSTLDIRAVIEQVRVEELTPEDKALISNVYGNQITYKCPKIWCDYFSTGFDNNEDRRKHVDSHERPFRCSDEGCFAFKLGYSRKCKLEEHMIQYHGPVEDEVRFPRP